MQSDFRALKIERETEKSIGKGRKPNPKYTFKTK